VTSRGSEATDPFVRCNGGLGGTDPYSFKATSHDQNSMSRMLLPSKQSGVPK